MEILSQAGIISPGVLPVSILRNPEAGSTLLISSQFNKYVTLTLLEKYFPFPQRNKK